MNKKNFSKLCRNLNKNNFFKIMYKILKLFLNNQLNNLHQQCQKINWKELKVKL